MCFHNGIIILDEEGVSVCGTYTQPHGEPSLALGSQSGFAEHDILQAGATAQVEPDTEQRGGSQLTKGKGGPDNGMSLRG